MSNIARMDAQKIKEINVLTDRVRKRKQIWEDAAPIVCPESSVLFTRSWKQTEGMDLDLRWAYSFRERLIYGPVVITEGELIVGALTKSIKGVELLGSFRPVQIAAMLADGRFARVYNEWTAASISAEDMEILRKDVAYWIDNLPEDKTNKILARELGEDYLDVLNDRAGVFEGPYLKAEQERGLWQDAGSWGGILAVHRPVLDRGLNYIIAFAQRQLDELKASGVNYLTPGSDAHTKYTVNKAAILMCQAIIDWAHLYSVEAARLSDLEKDPVRKAELEKISEICDWVPANKPRSYWEAVQFLRFIHLAVRKEQPHRPENSVGRLDQMLGPYYQADLEAGRLTAQDAAELLACFWLKIREGETLQTQPPATRIAPGSNLPNVTICGVNETGEELTGDMSWITLRVMQQMRLSEPAVYIRYSEKLSDEFLIYALECNRDLQGGIPAFLGDELGTQRNLARGAAPADACDWTASGCLSYHMECSEHAGGQMHLNQAKIFELAMHNGFDPRTRKQIGPKTGDFATFTNIEQVKEAFFKQLDYFADLLRRDYSIRWKLDQESNFNSGLGCAMLYEDCLVKGKAPSKGGARYPQMFTGWVGDRGTTDVADCVTAISYLVFDKKAVTMTELLKALDADWEGYDDLRQMCLSAPKYGNDNEYADNNFAEISMTSQKIIMSRPDPFTGEKPIPFKGAAAGHVIHGFVVGATPNGRKAGTPVNDAGTSAMAGRDLDGPTALINSATCCPVSRETWGNTHNMKFSKELFDSPEKLEKVLDLVKVFFKRGGWHIQFNITSAEELRAAKSEPDKWKSLMVRVGGYSAYFVDLPESLQDEIILRTEHGV